MAKFALLVAITGFLSVSCSAPVETGSAGEGGDQPIRIVATTGMVADVVREVAGDRATVTTLIPSGADPHLYKPTMADVRALQAADMIFYNGLVLEGKMGDVLRQMAKRGVPVHAVAERVVAGGYEALGGDGHADPHLWMDVAAWMRVVDVVAEALASFDAGAGEAYYARADDYRARMEKLETWARGTLATIPADRRVLVTAHDAFHYLGRAYGLEVRGIQGLSTESEAGVKDIEDLVNMLVERGIPAVFVETSVADKNVRALVEGAKARGHAVEVGGELFSDAMGAEGAYEGTYIGMIDHNVTTITRALGGQVDVGGMQDKLGHSAP